MSRNPHEYHYVAYIDEAGDPGIKKVKPDDPNGSSEWIVVSAALIPAELEGQVEGWVSDMMKAMNSHQLRDLHFQRLNSDRKLLVCNMLAEKMFACSQSLQTSET